MAKTETKTEEAVINQSTKSEQSNRLVSRNGPEPKRPHHRRNDTKPGPNSSCEEPRHKSKGSREVKSTLESRKRPPLHKPAQPHGKRQPNPQDSASASASPNRIASHRIGSQIPPFPTTPIRRPNPIARLNGKKDAEGRRTVGEDPRTTESEQKPECLDGLLVRRENEQAERNAAVAGQRCVPSRGGRVRVVWWELPRGAPVYTHARAGTQPRSPLSRGSGRARRGRSHCNVGPPTAPRHARGGWRGWERWKLTGGTGREAEPECQAAGRLGRLTWRVDLF